MAKKKKSPKPAEEAKLILDEMEEPVEEVEEQAKDVKESVEEAVEEVAEEVKSEETSEETDEKAAEDDENVSRETKKAKKSKKSKETAKKAEDAEEEARLWSAEYVLKDDEIEAFVDKSGLVESKKKTYIQAGLAALLFFVNLYSFIRYHRGIALVLALICAALCGALLIVPVWMRKQLISELKASASEEKPTRISGDGEALYFGAGEDTVSYTYDKVVVKSCDSFLTLLLDNTQMICVPKSAVPDEAWEELCSHIVEK